MRFDGLRGIEMGMKMGGEMGWGYGAAGALHKECLCVVYTEQFEYFMDKIRFRLPLVQYVH